MNGSRPGLDVDREWLRPPEEEPGSPLARVRRGIRFGGLLVGMLAVVLTTTGPWDPDDLSRLLGPYLVPLLALWMLVVAVHWLMFGNWSTEAQEKAAAASLPRRLTAAGAEAAVARGRRVRVAPLGWSNWFLFYWFSLPDWDHAEAGYLLIQDGWLQFYGERSRFGLRPEQLHSLALDQPERSRFLDNPHLCLEWLDPLTGRVEELHLDPQGSKAEGTKREQAEALQTLIHEWRTRTARAGVPPRSLTTAAGRVPLPPTPDGLPLLLRPVAALGQGWLLLLGLPGVYYVSREGWTSLTGWAWLLMAAVLMAVAADLRPRAACRGRLASPAAALPAAPRERSGWLAEFQRRWFGAGGARAARPPATDNSVLAELWESCFGGPPGTRGLRGWDTEWRRRLGARPGHLPRGALPRAGWLLARLAGALLLLLVGFSGAWAFLPQFLEVEAPDPLTWLPPVGAAAAGLLAVVLLGDGLAALGRRFRREEVAERLAAAGSGRALTGAFVTLRGQAAEAWDGGFLVLEPGWLQFYGLRSRFALRPEQVRGARLERRWSGRPRLRLRWRDPETARGGGLRCELEGDGAVDARAAAECLAERLHAWREQPAAGDPPESVRAADGRVPLPPLPHEGRSGVVVLCLFLGLVPAVLAARICFQEGFHAPAAWGWAATAYLLALAACLLGAFHTRWGVLPGPQHTERFAERRLTP